MQTSAPLLHRLEVPHCPDFIAVRRHQVHATRGGQGTHHVLLALPLHRHPITVLQLLGSHAHDCSPRLTSLPPWSPLGPLRTGGGRVPLPPTRPWGVATWASSLGRGR